MGSWNLGSGISLGGGCEHSSLGPKFSSKDVFPERGGRSVGGKSSGKIQDKFLTSWQKGGEKTPKWEVSLQSSMDSSGRGREAGNVYPEPLCRLSQASARDIHGVSKTLRLREVPTGLPEPS